MASLLEHDDHRKAGRALAIVSTCFILLDQCSSSFDTIGILGLNVHLTLGDLHRIFGYLCWLYFVIFLVRVIPNIGFDRLYIFRKIREEQRTAAVSVVAARQLREKQGNENDFNVAQGGLVVVNNKGKKNISGKNELKRITTERNSQNIIADNRLRNATKNYRYKYKFLGNFDYFLLYLTEVAPPLAFFVATFANLQPLICSSFSTI